MAEKERKDLTGFTDLSEEQKAAERKLPALAKAREYDLVANLLQAADFRNDEELVTEVEIRRGGNFLFSVHVRPVSDQEIRAARRKATKMIPNPNGKKLPKIEGEYNQSLFHDWLIYLSTTEEDQEKIWGNRAVMEKYGVLVPAESVDVLLTIGEKVKLIDTIMEISGVDDDGGEQEEDADLEEYAKN